MLEEYVRTCESTVNKSWDDTRLQMFHSRQLPRYPSLEKSVEWVEYSAIQEGTANNKIEQTLPDRMLFASLSQDVIPSNRNDTTGSV